MKFTVAENGIINTYDLNVGDFIYKIKTNTTKIDCVYNLGNKNTCGHTCVNCRPGKLFSYSIKNIKIKDITLNKSLYRDSIVINGFSWHCLPSIPPHIIGIKFPEKNYNTNMSIAITYNLALERLNEKTAEEINRIKRIK